MKNRKFAWLLLVALVGGVLASACGGAPAAGE